MKKKKRLKNRLRERICLICQIVAGQMDKLSLLRVKPNHVTKKQISNKMRRDYKDLRFKFEGQNISIS